jgi:DNA polymerase III psi subunit
LFVNATVEACAIFYSKEYVEDYTTLHVISRLLKNTKEGLTFEFDYYDFHEVSKDAIIEDSKNNIWRCNLLGGNRLNHLIKKLNRKTHYQTNLEDYLHNHLRIEKNRFRNGFQFANGLKSGSFITNKRVLLGANFSNEKENYTFLEKDTKFYLTNDEVLYLKPLINIKRIIDNGEFLLKFQNEDTAFNDTIVGISAPENKEGELLNLFNKLVVNEKINSLKTLATCSQFFLGSSTPIQKQDIANWTIPLDNDEINLTFSEKIIMIDVLDYIYPSWYLGENAPINKNEATINELKEFADIFNQAFNSIYKKENKEQKLSVIYEGETFFALEFEYSDNQINEPKIIDKKEADKKIKTLIENQNEKSKLVNRVLRIYTPNKITLIKPKKLRFWLKSIALQDSDETFDDIIENGLK